MDSPNPPDPLSRALAGWRVAPQRNPQFRTQVWTRLGAEAAVVPWGAYARRHAAGVAGAVALAMAVGALGGQGFARARAAAQSAQLAAVYVHGLDARVMTMR